MPDCAKGQFGYTRREERLNFATHLAALAAALAGSVYMLLRAARTGDAGTVAACAVFSISLCGVFAASSLYHGLPDGPLKYAAKKLDHISIYLIICGLYTALIMVATPNLFGAAVACAVWILGIWGTARKLAADQEKSRRAELWLYVSMSCLIFPIFAFLNSATIAFLLAAAALNILGLFFYVKKDREYCHVIWHAFSFAASACDYFAMLYACGL